MNTPLRQTLTCGLNRRLQLTTGKGCKFCVGYWHPKVINVQTSPVTDSTDGNKAPGDNIVVGGTDTGVDYPAFKGLRVYVRRLIDTRSEDERRYALLMDQLGSSRIPQRDYILRTNDNTVGNASYTDVAVLKAGRTKLVGTTTDKTEVELKRINPDASFQANTVYRPGDSIVTADKHYICKKQVTSGSAVTDAGFLANFEENYVHMQTGAIGTGYMPEDYFKNTQPILIFDDDLSEAEAITQATPLGWVLDETASGNVWEDNAMQETKKYSNNLRAPLITKALHVIANRIH